MNVRRRLAGAYERAGEKSRAAGQWRWLGDQHRARREFDAALSCYRAAVRQVPADFQTRELILEIHRHRRDDKQLVADGRPLADLLLRHNLADRARKLLQQLVQLLPDDAALRREYALVLTALGHGGAAIEQLHKLAEILKKRRAPDHELRDVHLRVLALDSSNRPSGIAYAKLTGTRAYRRLLLAATGVIVVAAIGAGLFVMREYQSREELAIALAQVDELVRDGRYEDAATELSRLEVEHRFTRSAEMVRAYRESVDAARQASVPVVKPVGTSLTTLAAEHMATAAFDAEDAGDLEKAHEILARLVATHPDTEAAQTAEVPLRVTPIPSDATVYLDGVELGQGDVELRYTPARPAVLRVERLRFEPVERTLSAVEELDLTVALSKPMLWRQAYDAEIVAQPLVLHRRLVIALSDRTVASVHPGAGDVLWRTPLGMYDEITAGPIESVQGVLVGTAAGNVFCLDVATGEVRWSATLEKPVVGPFLGGVVPSVTLADGSFHAPASAGLPPTDPGAVTPGTQLVLSGNRSVAFADGDGHLRVGPAFDPAKWSAPGSAVLIAPPAAEEGARRIWGLCADGQLRLYTKSARMLRALPAPDALPLAPCAVADTAIIACEGGRLLAYRASGEVVFDISLPEEAAKTPVLSAGRLLVCGTGGTLFVLDAETGQEKWRLATGTPMTQQAAATTSRIYVAAGDSVFAVER